MERHVCINCEEQGRASIVVLNQQGKCPVCNSDSVLSEAILLAFGAAKQKVKTAVVRESPDLTVRERVSQTQERIAESAAPVRAFLLRNNLVDINNWWQGKRYWIEWSFYDATHNASDYEYVDLILGNATDEKRLRFFINVADEGMLEVITR